MTRTTSDGAQPDVILLADLPAVPGYELLSELGRGGMGVVYRARDVQRGRMVALKLIRDGALAGTQERARFRIETEAAGRMRHANIVAIYEVGEHVGRPYFAMEVVDGPSLDQYRVGRIQSTRQAAELLRTLALAVAHAHAQNVVHRDLKPANILMTSGGVPKITDFGLAKRLDSQSTALTQEGAVLGTASYMPPEQAAGHAGDIGPAADVYALGAIFYELLTDRPPFVGQTWQETIDQVLHAEPSLPSRLRSEVPVDLETICLKCLEKEPARRYASAAGLADDLDRFLSGKPITAVPLGPVERLARFAARDAYQLVGEVGRGSRSVVYRAMSGPLQEPIAVKLFQGVSCTREQWEAQLQRHAESWVGLAHPHIVPIQRAGWWDGTPYMVMPFIPHGSLADRLAAQPIPVREALRLVEQLAETVSYLHRQGVVHGNLKPSNVLFAADGIPRISDCRLVGHCFEKALETAGLAYLPPELAGDPVGQLRPYTDIYALGAILYELLANRPPFTAATVAEMLEIVRSHEPLPPSRFNPQATPELDALCRRCLHKDPWCRYARAYNLMRRVRDLQDKMG